MREILKKTTREFREKPEAYYMNLLTNDIDMYRGDFLSPLPFVFSSASAFLFSAIASVLVAAESIKNSSDNPFLFIISLNTISAIGNQQAVCEAGGRIKKTILKGSRKAYGYDEGDIGRICSNSI